MLAKLDLPISAVATITRTGIPWPQPISTATGGEYDLTRAIHCHTYAMAIMAAIRKHLDSGRTLRQRILACATEEEIMAIVDNR